MHGLEDQTFEIVALQEGVGVVDAVGDGLEGEADVGVGGAGVAAGENEAGVLEAEDFDVDDEAFLGWVVRLVVGLGLCPSRGGSCEFGFGFGLYLLCNSVGLA